MGTLLQVMTKEQVVLNLLKNSLCQQAVDFLTCASINLDLSLLQNCVNIARFDEDFLNFYICLDHKAMGILLECPNRNSW